MAKLITEMSKAEIDEMVASQVLDEEEQEIENAFTSGKIVEGMGQEAANKEWQKVLANTRRKAPVTLRVSQDVIERIKAKAKFEGLPYQTLMNSILHKFAYGRMKDVD